MKRKFLLFFLVNILLSCFHANAQKTESYPEFTVKITGKGAPMFMIPGTACPGEVWNDLVKQYSRNYTCYVFTLAGYAGVPALTGDEFMPVIKKALTAYIVKRAPRHNAVLIGHNIGGFYGLWINAENPGLICKLIVVDAMPFLAAITDSTATETSVKAELEPMKDSYQYADDKMFAFQQKRMLATMITDTLQVNRALQWALASDRKTMTVSMIEMMSKDLRLGLGAIKNPVLVLGAWAGPYAEYPELGPGMIRERYEKQYRNLSTVRIEMIERSRHFIMLDQPLELRKATERFLKEK